MSKAMREAAPHVDPSQPNIVKCLARRPAFGRRAELHG